MFKKIIPYIIIGIVFFLAGLFIQSRNNENIKDRVSELEILAKSINDNQRKIESGIDGLGNTIDGIGKSIESLSGRYKNIETGFNRLEKYTVNSIDAVGKLIIGNSSAKGSSERIREIGIEFGNVLGRIEEGNKQ